MAGAPKKEHQPGKVWRQRGNTMTTAVFRRLCDQQKSGLFRARLILWSFPPRLGAALGTQAMRPYQAALKAPSATGSTVLGRAAASLRAVVIRFMALAIMHQSS